MCGAERMIQEFPDFPPCEQPEPPPNAPDYPEEAYEEDIRDARNGLNIERRDHAVILGFIHGFGENFREALEEKLYQDLEHIRFGYNGIWPEQYLAEVKSHCPLDVQAIKDAKAHFCRGWMRQDKNHPETIKKHGLRLTQEQDALRRGGVNVTDQDKIEHYLLEVYQSRAYSAEITRTFKQLNPEDQGWVGANSYFETAMKDQEEIERLMGDAPRPGTVDDINAALEQNFDAIFTEFDTKVDNRVREVVSEAIDAAI